MPMAELMVSEVVQHITMDWYTTYTASNTIHTAIHVPVDARVAAYCPTRLSDTASRGRCARQRAHADLTVSEAAYHVSRFIYTT